MASLLSLLAASLLLGLFTTQALPISHEPLVSSGATPERGLPGVASQSSALKNPTKRDISLNQDLRSLANMLLTQEYNRILSDRRNREFLRKLGKRGGSEFSQDEGFDADDGVLDFLPWGSFEEESGSRW